MKKNFKYELFFVLFFCLNHFEKRPMKCTHNQNSDDGLKFNKFYYALWLPLYFWFQLEISIYNNDCWIDLLNGCHLNGLFLELFFFVPVFSILIMTQFFFLLFIIFSLTNDYVFFFYLLQALYYTPVTAGTWIIYFS